MQIDQPHVAVVRIGVFAAQDGWLLTHPAVQSRFDGREEALAAARRLAHLETWRGRHTEILVQDSPYAGLTDLGSRPEADQEGWAAL